MILRVELFVRKIRRLISRSERAIRLLCLPKSEEESLSPGIVMIQVDGLSYNQLKQALKKKKMPFLRRLLKKEHYQLHHHYSGMPSSTPAVQAELFYGVKGAVPAFSFMDKKSGRVVRMFDPDIAAEIERHLEQEGIPLLVGGSAYSDIFTGGAEESHFCPSAMGWGDLIRAARPFALISFLISNAYSFIRVFILLIVEFFLALADCVSGLIDGHNLGKELKFVPTRVGICVLLRELVTIGAKIDVARGLPIIHLNFVGYDEQAHRRGPSSLFAHWGLKGIDDSIARIWRAAKRSTRRSYEIWIYSDHGQEKSQSYIKKYGRTIEEAVSSLFSQHEDDWVVEDDGNHRGIQSHRVRLLGGKRLQKIFQVFKANDREAGNQGLVVTAMGPLAFVYAPYALAAARRDVMAAELVAKGHVPLVLVCDVPGRVRAWTSDGSSLLPDEQEKIFGPRHPFLAEVCADMITLCQHENTGDFVLCGWRAGSPSITFAIENGSHCGAGPEETGAFALLPGDVILPKRGCGYLRPYDLRYAACRILDHPERRIVPRPIRPARQQTLRIMSYNIHSCLGMDGVLAPERIARVIAQHHPDIVALQEVDVGKGRTGGVDQARVIAECLEMAYHFSPTVRVEEELYGDAILTHLPMRLVKAGPLPGLPGKSHLEPRGALWVVITVGDRAIQCINTHLSLFSKERLLQAEALLGSEWLADPECRFPALVCGDFNATPGSPVCQLLQRRLVDAQLQGLNKRPMNTFCSRYPVARIDHVYTSPGIEVVDCEVPANELAQVASDHLPLVVTFSLK
ncbi:MAG: endonuclease/exonuclease/phosphatase family protein [Deltaproteobacteria bacterium]|nr:endonuclease/exonuclease/phosphatase family protein [Deltaproteobacteria bacterium]